MTRSDLRLWMCLSILLGVTAQAGAQDATPCEHDDACGAGTFCSGEGYSGGGSDDVPSDEGGGAAGDDGGDGASDGAAGSDGTSDPNGGVSAPDREDPIAEPPPAVIPGQCVPVPTGFCEEGQGCADGLTCVRARSYTGCGGSDGVDGSDGTDASDGADGIGDSADGAGGVAEDGSADAAPVKEPPPDCEPVEERYGSCELPEVECTSDDTCAPGLRCVVTAKGESCDSEGNCETFESKSCIYEPARCDDAPCADGYDCVEQTVPGDCSGGDGGCDENGCWTDDSVCEPDTFVKVCRIAFAACESDAGCGEGEKCLAFSTADGDLSVPQHWGVEGPVKSCVPAGSVLVAQTSWGLPEAPRNLSDAPVWSGEDDDGTNGGGDGTVDTGGDGPGGDGGDASDGGSGDDAAGDGSIDETSDDGPSEGGVNGDDGRCIDVVLDDVEPNDGSNCSVGFAKDPSAFASILLALGLIKRRRRRD